MIVVGHLSTVYALDGFRAPYDCMPVPNNLRVEDFIALLEVLPMDLQRPVSAVVSFPLKEAVD